MRRDRGGQAGDAAGTVPWLKSAMLRTIPASFPEEPQSSHPRPTLLCPNPVRATWKGLVSVDPLWRVIVVDDHPKLLKIAARLLASIPSVAVVGEATSGPDALEAVDRLRPNLVLTDLAMPGMDGLEVTRRLAGRPDAPAVVIMTVHDLPQYRDAALAAGACRFIAKADLAGQLRPLIQSLSTDSGAGGDETIV